MVKRTPQSHGPMPAHGDPTASASSPARFALGAPKPLRRKGPARMPHLDGDIGALQQAERRLASLFRGLVWVADASNQRLRFVSDSARTLLGYAPGYWHSPGFWHHHVHPADQKRVFESLAQAVAQDRDLVLEYRMAASDHHWVWLQDHIVVCRDPQGHAHLLGFAIDITERKQAEEEFRQAQAELERRVAERTQELQNIIGDLETFSYSLSHDVRAPLRAIQSYAELLARLRNEKLGPRERNFVEHIRQSASRLEVLVQDVLNYSRAARSPVELVPVDVEQVVQQVIHDHPALQEPQASVHLTRPLLPVQGQVSLLTLCLANLLTNAVKFVPPGQKPCVHIATQAAHGRVQVRIEDNGIGIAPENHQRIFRIFQRLHSTEQYEGTGIGLAVVQKAAERMGGRVGLHSAPGHGSQFWLELRPA